MGEKLSISVVMPARDEGQRIAEAISSIIAGRSGRFPLQIVVVDDQSTDGCCGGLVRQFSSPRDLVTVDVVRLPQWSGIPYARNVGAEAATGDILFITDANVRFPLAWDVPVHNHIGPTRALCATIADLDSSFRGYGGRLYLPSMRFAWLNNPGAFGGFVPLAPCSGTVLMKDLFRRAGGYDTAMPIYGAAEPEFSVRLWLSGAEIVCVPELILKHRFRPPSERQPFLRAINFVQVCNYLRFGMLYLDPILIRPLFRHYRATDPEIFDQAVRRVWVGDVWNRRDVLRQRLPKRFDSFATRFGIRRNSGAVSRT